MATFTFGASSSTRAGADPSQTQIDLLRAQLDVALARVPELETIHEMDEKLIKEWQEECNILRGQFAAKTKECEAKVKECDVARGLFNKARQSESETKELYRTLSSEHQQQSSDMAGLKDQLLEAEEALRKSRRETQRAEENVLDYEGRLAKFQKELEAEEVAHRKTKDEVLKLKGDVQQNEAHIKFIEEKLQECTEGEDERIRREERHKEELDAERGKYRSLQSRLDARNQEYATFKSDTEGMRRQFDPVKKALDVAKGELEDARQQIAELTGGEQRAIDAKDAVISGMNLEIAALKKDAAPRINVRPNAYQDDPNAPPPKQKDLLKEIVDSRSSTTESSSNHEPSSEATATDASSEDTEEEEQDDVEKPKLEGNDDVYGGENIRIVTLPGETVYISSYITTTIRDLNPLTAWLTCERNIVILLFGFFVYVGLGWSLPTLRTPSSVDHNPLPSPPSSQDGAAADGDSIAHVASRGDANASANVALVMSNIGLGVTPAPGGPPFGTDPNDAPPSAGNSSSGPPINLEDFFDPIDPPADTRVPFGADNDSNNSNGSNTSNGSNNTDFHSLSDTSTPVPEGPPGPPGPPAAAHTGPEGFFDIGNAPTPNPWWTLLAFIFHLVVQRPGSHLTLPIIPTQEPVLAVDLPLRLLPSYGDTYRSAHAGVGPAIRHSDPEFSASWIDSGFIRIRKFDFLSGYGIEGWVWSLWGVQITYLGVPSLL
ncbi:uncharacterized protein PAC_12707 [Phialocephala subalpina]|uniref:Uncharacterized protein n=1 Tax=Phialocephala subalpina TaxID=576137 RepID=A0A1L7XCN8_9HELO|nr:uncharacterized protein PAC_12707 [Phialocephala subalpina]